MSLTLQRKLELAGALSKVQPELQRLHLLRKPKKRRRLRTVVIAASAIAAGTAVAVVVLRRRARPDDPFVGGGLEAYDVEPTFVETAFDADGVPEAQAHAETDAGSGPGES